MLRLSQAVRFSMLFVFSAVFVAACSSDDESPPRTDTEPNAFELGDGATVSTPESYAESAAILVSGINSAATISITNGQFRIVGVNEYTDTPVTTIEPDQVFQVRVQASLQVDQTETATLTIGTQSDTFSVLTEDTTGPTASVVFPTPATLSDGNTLTLRGTATDDFGPVTSVQVTVTPTGGSPVVFDQTVTEGDLQDTWSVLVNLNTDTVNTISVVAVDEAGNIQDTPAVLTVTQTTTPETFNFPVGNDDHIGRFSFSGVAWDREGQRLFLPGSSPLQILAVDINTGERSVFIAPNPDFTALSMLEVLPQQNLLVFSERLGATIYSRGLAGGDLSEVSNVSSPDSDVDIIRPEKMQLHSSGDLYVVDSGGDSLYRVNIESGSRSLVSDDTRPAAGSDPFNFPVSLVLDETNNRAMVADNAEGQLLWVDLTSGERSEFLGSDVLTSPFDVLIDADENRIILVDQGLDAVLAVDLTSKLVTVLSSDAVPGGGANDLNEPWAIEFDGDSNIAFVVSGETLFSSSTAIKMVDLSSGERVILSNSIP